MKTNIKTIAAILILATIGFTNIHVVAGENKTGKNLLTGAVNQNVFANNFLAANEFSSSAERKITRDAELEFEAYFEEKRVAEAEKSKSEFIETAETLTAEGADKEITKYLDKIVSLENAKSKK